MAPPDRLSLSITWFSTFSGSQLVLGRVRLTHALTLLFVSFVMTARILPVCVLHLVMLMRGQGHGSSVHAGLKSSATRMCPPLLIDNNMWFRPSACTFTVLCIVYQALSTPSRTLSMCTFLLNTVLCVPEEKKKRNYLFTAHCSRLLKPLSFACIVSCSFILISVLVTEYQVQKNY